MLKEAMIFIRDINRRVKEDNMSAFSAQVTFYILLSLFPFIMFLLTLTQYTNLTKAEVILQISEIFPTQVTVILLSVLNDISRSSSNAVLSITVIAAVWSASRGILFIIKGLNAAYRINETRNYIILRVIASIYTVIFALIIILSLILLVFGNRILLVITDAIPITLNQVLIINFIRFAASIGLLLLFFIFIYNLIPNQKFGIKHVMPGAFFSSMGWILISYGFSIYVDNVSNLSYMYGSLTGIVVLLLWLSLCSNTIMIGGEINAYLYEKRHTGRADI